MEESWMLDEEMEEEQFALFKMQIFFWPVNRN